MRRPWKLSVGLVFGVLFALSFTMFAAVKPAIAANPTTIPFQGKVVSNASGLVGTNVADGTYTFIFKLYNTATSTGSTATTASCTGDTHCLWAESDSITVTSGVFQVNLGANTSLSTIDFNANNALYLGVEFNADTAEMSPRPQLSSVPYAFNADKVGGIGASQIAQLQTGTVAAQTGALSVTAGITSGATVQGASVVATGAVQSASLTVQSATYTTNQVIINDGQTTAPPTAPASFVPELTVVSSQTSGSRPLFFGYNGGAAYAAFLTSGACGSFTQMCLDLGNGSTVDTALQNVGSTLNIGGTGGTVDDGAFSTIAIAPSGTAATTVGGTLAVAGLASYGNNIVFTGAAAASITGASNQALTLASTGTGKLNLTSANGTIGINATTLQSTATGITNIDLSAASTTTLQIENSNASNIANLNLLGGSLETGTTPVIRLTNAGALTNITGITQTAGTASFTQNAADQFKIQAAAVPSTDMADITNASFPITTDGVNAEQVDYYAALAAAASQASALRLNITNTSTVAGSTTNALRLVTTTSASAGNTNGIKIDAITAGSGIASALNIGTGWTNLLQSSSVNISGAVTPTASATSALIQVGSAIAGGNNTTTTGGTYLSINTPASGAGSTADFLNFENGGASNFKVANDGSITASGSIGGGVLVDSKTDTTGTTYPETSPQFGYYLSATSATTNAAITSVFNITGLPAVDGTEVAITAVSAKGISLAARVHTTTVQIAGTTISTLTTTSTAAAATTTRSFILMRINGIWAVVGEGPTAALGATSTVNTADYAEYIDYSGDVAPQPGDVVAVADQTTSVKQDSKAYDPTALGVVSTSPYQVGGADDGHSVILALTGRVPVNVSLQNGPIKAGDKLTASATTGAAMKATKAGHIIGTALSEYDGSQDTAQVIMQLGVGYDNPNDDAAAEVTSADASNNGALQPETDTTPAVTTDDGITTVGSQALKFVDGAGLDLTSDVSGNAISLVDTPDNLAKANANGIFVQQGKAASGATTGLSGALTIDNADANLPIGAAINITNSGGGGYTSVISSTNFSVSGNGDVSANGAYVSKNGSFQLLDASGKKLINFDNNGNGTLTGALNVANANVSGGLTVGGDLNVAGLSTFQKLSTFLAKTVFRQDVEFDGHITVANDSAGYASLRPGETSVHVSFQKPYDITPVVNASVTSGQFILNQVANITPQGFDITIQTADKNLVNFSWTAVAVNNPQTATNPVTPVSTTTAASEQ